MERGLQSHPPFSCLQCLFVAENAEVLSDHLLEHNHPPSYAQETEAASPTVRNDQPHVSIRQKSNPALSSSLPEDGHKQQAERKRNNIKRMSKALTKGNLSAGETPTLPTKEYLAAGTEQVYRTHTCPMCRRCFKMRSHLQEHLHIHFPEPSLQCPTCKRYFTSKSKLRIHRLREAGEKVHSCHLCEYSAVERNAIRRHIVSVHAGEAEGNTNSHSYACPTCGQRFGQSRSLKVHMKTHIVQPDSQPVACFKDGCTFQSSIRKELLRHTVEAHGMKAVECRHHACGSIFPKEADMELHYRTHLAYHCSQCEFSCSNKSVFLQHRRLGHPGSNKLCCDFCTFTTFNPVQFEQHVGHLHANEKIHRCSQCSYMTSHKRGLKRHMLMHSGEKPHKCNLCDFRCRDDSYLSKHMLTHSEDKNFMCAECGYVTKWKHYLNVHMRKHAGDLRYHCDQCPYRCHRMDQLNSHKLRHQAKSLMCEICAYACKRKNELRNHMLAKHSGEEKQPSAYQCKYCAYTTCYKQALQNHENCKHTKLKEFRCALCFYFSFSSISLFLHKRKAHGYVPGDKAWLENYAAKEREMNSAELVQDFYNKPSTAPEEQSTKGLLPSQREQSELSATADNTVPGSQPSNEAHTANVVSQDTASEGTSPVNPAEEYCMLVLTALPTTDQQQQPLLKKTEEQSENPTSSTAACDKSQKKADLSKSISSAEDDDAAATSNANEECEKSDVDDGYEPSNDVDGQWLVATGACQRPDGAASDQNMALKSDLRQKDMKKHDKDQAEAMVLGGRVQMLMVPTKHMYRCDKCSYVTCRETTLEYHCQSLCQGRAKAHRCQACGAEFKQRRSLDSHITLKKCPAQPSVGISGPHLGTEETVTHSEEASKQLPERRSDRTQPPTSHTESSADSNHRHQKGSTSSGKGCQTQRTRRNKLLKGKHVRKLTLSDKGRSGSPQKKSLLTKTQGKFKCMLCRFSSVRRATVERHISTCSKEERQCDDELVDEKVAQKTRTFSCPSCEFKCSQSHALRSHKRRGCMKPGGVQRTGSEVTLAKRKVSVNGEGLRCQQCAFTCKTQKGMAQHVARKHRGAGPHCCQFCPFSTTRRYRVEQHESLHTGIGRHTCDVCDKTFGAAAKLRQHQTRVHDEQPTHFCSSCDFSSSLPDNVRRHELRCHTGNLEHTCTQCDAHFSSAVALQTHCKRAHLLQVAFSCKQCEYTCSSKVTLKTHQLSKHSPLQCTSCRESFETKDSLEKHQRSHLAHRCQLCPFAAKTRQLLAQHLLNQHEDGPSEEKPLRCSTCQFACRHQLVLEQHLRSHGGRRLYRCTDCEYSTPNKQKITWHLRIHTGEKPCRCELCSYTCTDPSRLKLHMRVHQEEKKYLCPECGYKCKWATQLKYHMTKHTGEKPYACDECEYRTNRADALRAHRDTQHCDTRPYVCETCGKAFKTSFILKTHQRQHSNDRPYTCGLCHKAFRWPAGLRHHYLSHTKQQPFRCRHCSYSAKQKFQVVKHLHRHHPGISAEQGVVRDSAAVSLTLKEALQGTLEERMVEVEEQGSAGITEV
ncbi:zinc finger protein 142 [Betta splendens]|uniref:Zinc finger protein 142 n=1 Tax=Betta splendens TaxID=158456 RepID=A0A6P7LCF1_BETSP|nr:zinc finger protein 142 [Betta splendens]XP_028992087.1 zinc finger protein 142 [Betta splendens]XP_028992088.1 zinc finger protein 142 [Betta splendens]XP_028992089.1 zinc finger protein 142 [Betta splendens]